MFDFSYYTPTKIVFGRGAENRVGELTRAFGGRRALVHYGGRSAVASGLLDRVRATLDAAGVARQRRHEAWMPHNRSAPSSMHRAEIPASPARRAKGQARSGHPNPWTLKMRPFAFLRMWERYMNPDCWLGGTFSSCIHPLTRSVRSRFLHSTRFSVCTM